MLRTGPLKNGELVVEQMFLVALLLHNWKGELVFFFVFSRCRSSTLSGIQNTTEIKSEVS